MKKRVIVPFFISHQGCPHQCVFCDQRAITGSNGSPPTAVELLETIGEWRRSAHADTVEVAFYGGTFSALPADFQERLLSPLQPLLRSGEVCSVRVSTRPDSLDERKVGFLRDFGVDLVELGIQSMDDAVLAHAGRGHLAVHSEKAFALLRRAGIRVGAQLMPGLPGDSATGAVESLQRLLPLRPDLLRIYPAVVLKGTELARLYRAGSYRPLSIDEAVRICKVMLQVAAVAGITVIRVGLHPSDDLTASGELLAGPYHPAFRQLAEGERWYDLLNLLCTRFSGGEELDISVSPVSVSDLAGQKRINVRRIEAAYPVRLRGMQTDASLGRDDIVIRGRSATISANLVRDLRYNSSMIAIKECA
ncbi:MAG TPA: radical SAM protein [Geobacteraceae bacterium]|nr:radical SAM protein [Geobacteraceae bacterium]